MEKKITLEAGQTIEINGAVLTPRLIEQIKAFQENGNIQINQFREHIADAICFIARETVDYDGIDKEERNEILNTLSCDLSYCRDYLIKLRRPYDFNS
ncbi:MAG: hypothetical protein AB7U05_02575 [Mangrovibacterium sp.]